MVFIAWYFCLPNVLFNNPTSTVVKSRDGVLLGARIADDGQWRFPKTDSVPYKFEQCILHFEDEYFYNHPGFNPVSLVKAIYHNITSESRRGGSTLTQQVIRLSRKNKGRTYFEKGIELIQATRLEARFGKKEILNLYASHAPFGGNVVGLETASWRYFNLPSQDLSWGQAAALAVLPNAPSLIFPGKNEAILKRKRDKLLLKLFNNEVIDNTTYQLAILERLPGKPYALPQYASHFIEKIRKENPGVVFQSTIRFSLQNRINQIAKDHHLNLRQNEINNLAILVLDVETREVLAYIGNAPTTSENNKFVDIIDKPRSTGSVLKPLLYASLLDAGEILPNTLVLDIPTTINGYQPENFNKKYNGAVPLSTALTRSLNVPAVRLLQKHGLQRFYNTLQKMDLGYLDKPANYYGLSLILGGAESSLWDITKIYAGMASILNYYTQSSSEYRETEFINPVYELGKEVDFGAVKPNAPIVNAGAIYNTLNSLKEVNRPQGEENWAFFDDSQFIAWKTGTSFGFKDAWAVGTTPKYTIGIWVGNADGEGRPGLTGIQAAAPILFDVLKILPKSGAWFEIPYDALVEAKICIKSGHLASVYCEDVITKWINIEGKKTINCPYHHTVFLNEAETFRVNSSCYELENMKQKTWFTLPPIMEYYYAPLHPEYKTLPNLYARCFQENEKLMEFIFPKKNESILLPKDFDETINDVVFKLAHRNSETPVYWYLNLDYIGTTTTFHEMAISPKPGKYTLTVVDQEGNELKQNIEIIRAQ